MLMDNSTYICILMNNSTYICMLMNNSTYICMLMDNSTYVFLYVNFYRGPLLQAWLLPDLNTIPTNCVRENSL